MITLLVTVAFAQNSAVYVPDSTWAAEDLREGSDADQNDVVVRYNKRCVVHDATEDLVSEDLRIAPMAAGAAFVDALLLRFDDSPTSVTLSADGGASSTPLCTSEVTCGTEVTLLAAFKDGFVSGGAFVNTVEPPFVDGRDLVVEIVYPPGVPAATDGLGAVTCALPDFAVLAEGDASPIDATSVLATNGQPLVGNFADHCPTGSSCPTDPLAPWSIPTERTSVGIAYGAPFLAWLTDQTDATPCTRGVDCVNEDWYQHPGAAVLSGATLALAADLQPAPTCSDGVGNGDEVAVDCGGLVCGACFFRVNVSSTGAQGNGFTADPSISADGRYVAFYSSSTNYVTTDTSLSDVFLRDTVEGTTVRISQTAAGVGGNNHSQDLDLSADGRYVAFRSEASNLVPGAVGQILVYDRVAGTFDVASRSTTGSNANGDSSEPEISADGRFVTFYSQATNLVTGDTNGVQDIFVRDRQLGTTVRVSVSTAGVASNGLSNRPSISDDGRYVAFESDGSNLVAGDTNGSADIFVRDLVAGTTTRVSTTAAGGQGNGGSNFAWISPDGRYVAFATFASNLVAGDGNGTSDVFLRDLVGGTLTLISGSTGGPPGNGYSYKPSADATGRYVLFTSAASNLVSGDTNGQYDVFVRDTVAGTTTRVSVSPTGAQGNGGSAKCEISADGSWAVFESDASNLVTGDSNGNRDIFVALLP